MMLMTAEEKYKNYRTLFYRRINYFKIDKIKNSFEMLSSQHKYFDLKTFIG
jgi:hypothetical protein